MLIRGLGAYGKGESLESSLRFELTRSTEGECCAMLISRKTRGWLPSGVCLLVKNSARIKLFNGDCYSVSENGKLRLTRNANSSKTHRECWVHPEYIAIVLTKRISKKALETVQNIAQEFGLKVLHLTKEMQLLDDEPVEAVKPKLEIVNFTISESLLRWEESHIQYEFMNYPDLKAQALNEVKALRDFSKKTMKDYIFS